MTNSFSDRELENRFKEVSETSNDNRAILTDKIDDVQNVIELKLGTFEHNTRESLTRIETQVAFTNGKLRKVIVALIFLSGLSLGFGIIDAKVILPFIGL